MKSNMLFSPPYPKITENAPIKTPAIPDRAIIGALARPPTAKIMYDKIVSILLPPMYLVFSIS